jgi:outer membrane immunogenic protein
MNKSLLGAILLMSASAAGAQSFSGPSVELRGGWDSAKITANSANDGTTSSVAYGAAVGYDFELGQTLVVGAIAGINGSSVKKCDSGYCVKPGRDVEALGRIGFKVTPAILVYGLGGYSNAAATVSRNGVTTQSDFNGIRGGAGLQLMVTNSLYGKIEYRYTKYSDKQLAGSDVRAKRNHALVAVGFRF